VAKQLIVNIRRRFANNVVIAAELGLDLDATPVSVLFGPSGAGKTTLLRCLAGLERPDEGFIRYHDEVWFDANHNLFVPPQPRRIGYLFQDYALFPHLTVERNISYGLTFLSRPERAHRVTEVLEGLGIEELRTRFPAQISGGERQRVALARAVAPRPRLVLLDEPLSALDAPTREKLRIELRKQLLQLGIPAIVVTHDRTEALALADLLVVMAEGRARQTGPAHEVFQRPADLAVARSVGTESVVSAEVIRSHDGIAELRVGEAVVQAAGPEEIPIGHGFLCIRAEDVVLAQRQEIQASSRNQLWGTVTSVVIEGALVRVSVDCGFPLTALVTKQACEELRLFAGERVVAAVKATAVHFIPRG
jgi:molybdate transport system ATP-binding protein